MNPSDEKIIKKYKAKAKEILARYHKVEKIFLRAKEDRENGKNVQAHCLYIGAKEMMWNLTCQRKDIKKRIETLENKNG